jgi:Methane oxygenase PmoA
MSCSKSTRVFAALGIVCFALSGSLAAAATLVVPAEDATLQLDVAAPLKLGFKTGDAVELAEVGANTVVPAQLLPGVAADGTLDQEHPRLVADVPSRQGSSKERRFQLRAAPRANAAAFAFHDKDEKSLALDEGQRPVLVYNHGTIVNEKVPAKDVRRSRACYIHPLYGLDGEVLTDDFPKDHYHHHGVFWTWPHVEIDGKQYDLWMNKGIRPEFVVWLGRQAGPLAAALGVENGWFVGDKKVMVERVWIRAGHSDGKTRAVDLDMTWIPVDRPITLRGAEGKSYGGLTVRFAVRNQKQSTITVPTGTPKEDLPDTPLPWADMTASFAGGKGPSGAAIFVPLDQPDYPPTWLTRHYGPLCIGWPGVHGKTFPPGRPIHLAYRLWIHSGAVSGEELERAYAAYAAKARWE